MTRQISLYGVWQYEPLAWVTLGEGGVVDERAEILPAPGEMTIPGRWRGPALQSFDGRVRFSLVGGPFQFMFMDCWPSITWSVVDADRTAKAGYRTLQQVFQPVLIGVDLPRESIIATTDRGGHARPFVVTP